MKYFTSVNHPEVARLLGLGAVGILRTDTLYGIVAKADNERAVERVFDIKGRSEHKSPIVLISSHSQLYDTPSAELEHTLQDVWPGSVSVIIPSTNAPLWIQRGNNSVAYRLPNQPSLEELVALTGPLIAPSANPQGLPPARSIDEAEAYFGSRIDFYVDGGVVAADAPPSQLLKVHSNHEIERLR